MYFSKTIFLVSKLGPLEMERSMPKRIQAHTVDVSKGAAEKGSNINKLTAPRQVSTE